MTREEAIERLKMVRGGFCADTESAINMAIEALSEEEKLKEQLANCHKEILRLLDLGMTEDDDSNYITESANDVVEKNDEVIERPIEDSTKTNYCSWGERREPKGFVADEWYRNTFKDGDDK